MSPSGLARLLRTAWKWYQSQITDIAEAFARQGNPREERDAADVEFEGVGEAVASEKGERRVGKGLVGVGVMKDICEVERLDRGCSIANCPGMSVIWD